MKRSGFDDDSGMMKKARQHDVSPAIGPPDSSHDAAALGLSVQTVASRATSYSSLGPLAQAEFQALFQSMKVTTSDINDSIYKSLADFHDPTAAEIVQGFARADLLNVRNKTGFFIGIIKTYRKNQEGLKSGSGSSSGGHQMLQRFGFSNPSVVSGHPSSSPPALYPSTYDPYGAPSSSQMPFTPQPQYSLEQVPGYGYEGYSYPLPQQDQYQHQSYQPALYQSSAPQDIYNYSSYYGYAPEPARAGRVKGKGLPGLSKPLQDMFNHMFTTGHLSQDDVPDSIFDSLQDFDESVQFDIVERFSKADLMRVRNKTGYLIGILKIARQGKASGHGFGASTVTTGAAASLTVPVLSAHSGGGGYQSYITSAKFKSLAPYVQNRFKEMIATNVLGDGDLDLGIFDSLAAFDEASQVEIIDIFASKDLSQIRNKTGFFIGIIKKQRVLRQNQDMVSGWN